MIQFRDLEKQLKRIDFRYKGWGRTEVCELCNILMPDEEIEECVNGYYEAGFALLVATKSRVLLVDKKPLNYLTVEDLRFDMINEFDYHHRLLGAQIRISAGVKTLHFTSLNQGRLRRLLNYVQTRMTQIKKDQDEHQTAQKQHLEEMNEQLRRYLQAAQLQIQGMQQGLPTMTYPQPQMPAGMSGQASQLQPRQPQMAVSGPPPAITSRSTFEQAAAASALSVAPEAARGDAPRGPVPAGRYQQALQYAGQIVMTPQQIGLAAARRVVPVISAYTRLPLMNQRRARPQTTSRPSAAY